MKFNLGIASGWLGFVSRVALPAYFLMGSLAAGTFEELSRFHAPQAKQGVAVDAGSIYVISNHAIGKYSKDTHELLIAWECEEGEPLIHLNSGIVIENRLICAHSNYPRVPMTSSIEIFDTVTLKPIESYSFGIFKGSLTWLDYFEGNWYACFAHYSNRAAEPNRDPGWSTIVQMNETWQPVQSWVFPAELIAAFDGYSSSGGAFGPDGRLYVTGHDHKKLYVLDFPSGGSEFEWLDTIDIEAEGQAFCWDKGEEANFYSILKRNREVIIGRIR